MLQSQKLIKCAYSSIILRAFRQSQLLGQRCLSKRTLDLSSIIKPVTVEAKKNPDDINIGYELTSNPIKKEELIKTLNLFYRLPEVKYLADEQGLDQRLFSQAFLSFRKFCIESDALPVELHIVMSDILTNAGHVSDIFPYFLKHAKRMFPHIECMEDLKKISDLTNPLNWYPEARAHGRKIIFHSGPTNSGKTYQALQKFINAKSGIYCGPLKMLANEVFHKCNENGTLCDLVTGEERKLANPDGQTLSNHISCTVEMTKLSPDYMPASDMENPTLFTLDNALNSNFISKKQQSNSKLDEEIKHNHYEVAIVDEIQMIRDPIRGWAWTRALLGLVADEIHLCGEKGAIQLVQDLLSPLGETIEVRSYKRLTPLKIMDKPLGTLANIKDGDCIVCFSKNDIYTLSQKIEAQGRPCAVIYGGLPPGTKLEQAKRFNDPENPCKIMVATDAIGMGINLCIKRIIFYSLLKPTTNEDTGEREMERLSVSQALQIAGRAGRFGMMSQYIEDELLQSDIQKSPKLLKSKRDKSPLSKTERTTGDAKKLLVIATESTTPSQLGGEVTAFSLEDLYTLKDMLQNMLAETEPIETAGLHPTAEQIELFAYHLPKASLSNLIDIFTAICTVDNAKYFMCNMEDFKFLADACQHIPLPLKVRYVFCCAPISRKQPFVCAMFIKFARQFSRGNPLTFDWLCTQLNDWPFAPPLTISDLIHLEGVFDVLDMYLWLSYRFPHMFPDTDMIRDMQCELDAIIKIGVNNLTKLLCNNNNNSNYNNRTNLNTNDSATTHESDSNLSRSKYNNRRNYEYNRMQGKRANTNNLTYENSDPHNLSDYDRKVGQNSKKFDRADISSTPNSESRTFTSAYKGGTKVNTTKDLKSLNKTFSQPSSGGKIPRLTDQLIRSGVISRRQIGQLQAEWATALKRMGKKSYTGSETTNNETSKDDYGNNSPADNNAHNEKSANVYSSKGDVRYVVYDKTKKTCNHGHARQSSLINEDESRHSANVDSENNNPGGDNNKS